MHGIGRTPVVRQSRVQPSKQLGDLGAHETFLARLCRHERISAHTTIFAGVRSCNSRIAPGACHILHELHCLLRPAAVIAHFSSQHQASNAEQYLANCTSCLTAGVSKVTLLNGCTSEFCYVVARLKGYLCLNIQLPPPPVETSNCYALLHLGWCAASWSAS